MKFKDEQFYDFVDGLRQAVTADAEMRGYNGTVEIMKSMDIGISHALGQIICKTTRFREYSESQDLVKIAAYAFIAWVYGQGIEGAGDDDGNDEYQSQEEFTLNNATNERRKASAKALEGLVGAVGHLLEVLGDKK